MPSGEPSKAAVQPLQAQSPVFGAARQRPMRRPPVPRPQRISEPSSGLIPISAPDLGDLERRYLLEAFDSSWISSTGSFVDRFESDFAKFVQTRHAISCVNGTAALHLALLGLGIGPGDEVIVPSLTYVATANAVRYVGAEPVFADCDEHSWTLDPQSVRRMVTKKTRAIVPVHLFGNPADMAAIRQLGEEHGLFVIEDACEAHGARYAGRPIGSLGHVSTFSFYGNKILATGEGGIVCTDDDDLARRIRTLRGQGVNPGRPYWFDVVGYNYRMTNLACAIGAAQLARFDELCRRREQLRVWYDRMIGRAELQLQRQTAAASAAPVLWMYGVVLDDACPVPRDAVRERLAKAGIETRPFFSAVDTLPMYADCRRDGECPISRRLGDRGIMLPTHTRLNEVDVDRIVNALAAAAAQRDVPSRQPTFA